MLEKLPAAVAPHRDRWLRWVYAVTLAALAWDLTMKRVPWSERLLVPLVHIALGIVGWLGVRTLLRFNIKMHGPKPFILQFASFVCVFFAVMSMVALACGIVHPKAMASAFAFFSGPSIGALDGVRS